MIKSHKLPPFLPSRCCFSPNWDYLGKTPAVLKVGAAGQGHQRSGCKCTVALQMNPASTTRVAGTETP